MTAGNTTDLFADKTREQLVAHIIDDGIATADPLHLAKRLRRHLIEGRTLRDVEVLYGVRYEVLRDICQRESIVFPRSGGRRTGIPVRPDRRPPILWATAGLVVNKLVADGLTLREVERQTGIDISSLCAYAKRRGLALRRGNPGTDRIDWTDLHKPLLAMIAVRTPLRVISTQLGVSAWSVARYMKNNDLILLTSPRLKITIYSGAATEVSSDLATR